ncbi:MAG: hypothetical protein AAF745_09255 [Planctomycetota bacterium]
MTASTDDHATPQTNPHADKYSDPRVKFSRRGLLFFGVVILFGVFGAGFSIYARRTRLEQTTRFWGDEVILALQLAEEIELLPSLDPNPETGEPPEPVRLSGMPGLGHLRHVLLDERSYHWETESSEPITSRRDDPAFMVLRLTDPSAERFSEVNIALALESGWVGLKDGQSQVQLNDRFRTAMPNFLKRIANYEPLRAEMRDAEKAAAASGDE